MGVYTTFFGFATEPLKYHRIKIFCYEQLRSERLFETVFDVTNYFQSVIQQYTYNMRANQ